MRTETIGLVAGLVFTLGVGVMADDPRPVPVGVTLNALTGQGCFIPWSSDIRSAALAAPVRAAAAESLDCADSVLLRYHQHIERRFVLSGFPAKEEGDGPNPPVPCAIRSAIGIAEDADLYASLKTAFENSEEKIKLKADATKEATQAATERVAEQTADRYRDTLKKLAPTAQDELAFCLFLARHRDYSQPRPRTLFAFERGLEKVLQEERGKAAVDWVALFRDPQRNETLGTATVACKGAQAPSPLAAFLFRERLLEKAHRESVEAWRKTAGAAAARVSVASDVSYRIAIQDYACRHLPKDQRAEILRNVADAQKIGVPPGQLPAPWIAHALVAPVNGQTSVEVPIASYLSSGIPLEPGDAKTRASLDRCPALKRALSESFADALRRWSGDAEPLGTAAFVSKPAVGVFATRRMQSWLRKTEIAATLADSRLLCAEDGSSDAVAVAAAFRELLAMDPIELEALANALKGANSETHEISPTTLQVKRKTALVPYCLLPQAHDPRFYVSRGSALPPETKLLLDGLENDLFPEMGKAPKRSIVETHFLWHANGRLGAEPETRWFSLEGMLRWNGGAVAWDTMFGNRSTRDALRKKFLPEREGGGYDASVLNDVRASALPAVSAALLREYLLDELEKSQATQVRGGTPSLVMAEQRASAALRASLCERLRTGSFEAKDEAADLRRFVDGLRGLAGDNGPAPRVGERQFQLFLAFDSKSRLKLLRELTNDGCYGRRPAYRDALLSAALLDTPAPKSPIDDRQRWFDTFEKHRLACAIAEDIDARVKQAKEDQKKLTARLHGAVHLHVPEGTSLDATLLGSSLEDLRRIRAGLKELPAGFGLPSVAPVSPGAQPALTLVVPPTDAVRRLAIERLPRGDVGEEWRTKAMAHLDAVIAALDAKFDEGKPPEAIRQRAAELLNGAWEVSYGIPFIRETSYELATDDEKKAARVVAEKFIADVLQNEADDSDRKVAKDIRQRYQRLGDGNLRADADARRLYDQYEKNGTLDFALQRYFKKNPAIPASTRKQIVLGMSVLRRELREPVLSLKAKVAAGSLVADEVDLIEEVVLRHAGALEKMFLRYLERSGQSFEYDHIAAEKREEYRALAWRVLGGYIEEEMKPVDLGAGRTVRAMAAQGKKPEFLRDPQVNATLEYLQTIANARYAQQKRIDRIRNELKHEERYPEEPYPVGVAMIRAYAEGRARAMEERARKGELDAQNVAAFVQLLREEIGALDDFVKSRTYERTSPVSPADRERGTAFVVFRKLALDQVTTGKVAVVEPSASVARYPDLVRLHERATELRATALAMRALVQSGKLKTLPSSAEALLRLLDTERGIFRKEVQRLKLLADAGTVPPSALVTLARAYDVAANEVENALVRHITQDMKLPSALAHPQLSRVTLRFQDLLTQNAKRYPYSIEGFPLDVLGKHAHAADAVFEYLRANDCDGYGAMKDYKSRLRSQADLFRWDAVNSIRLNRTVVVEDAEAIARLPKWACWAAKVCGPIEGNNVADRQKECREGKEAYNAVRGFLEFPRIEAIVPDDDPHAKRVREVFDDMLYGDALANGGVAARLHKVSFDEPDVYRKVAAMIMRLPEKHGVRLVAAEIALPLPVRAVYFLARNGKSEKGNDVVPVSIPELREFEDLMTRLPMDWFAREQALAKAGIYVREGSLFHHYVASMRDTVAAYQKQADPAQLPSFGAPVERRIDEEALRLGHRRFVDETIRRLRSSFDAEGVLKTDHVQGLELPFDEITKAFEHSEALGGDDLSLAQARNFLMGQRVLLRAAFRPSTPGTVCLHPAFFPLFAGNDALAAEPKFVCRESAKFDGKEQQKLRSLESALAVVVRKIDQELERRNQGRDGSRAMFDVFTRSTFGNDAELRRWEAAAQRAEPGVAVPTKMAFRIVEEAWKDVARGRIMTDVHYELVAPVMANGRKPLFQRPDLTDREEVARPKGPAWVTGAVPSVQPPPDPDDDLEGLHQFAQALDVRDAKDLWKLKDSASIHLLNSIYGMEAARYEGDWWIGTQLGVNRTGSSQSHRDRNNPKFIENARIHMRNARAKQMKLQEQLMGTESYRGVPPGAAEMWRQLPPFLRDALRHYGSLQKDATESPERRMLPQSDLRAARDVLYTPWPGRIVEFFRNTQTPDHLDLSGNFWLSYSIQLAALTAKKLPVDDSPLGKIGKFFTEHARSFHLLAFSKVADREKLRDQALAMLQPFYDSVPVIKAAKALSFESWGRLPTDPHVRAFRQMLSVEAAKERDRMAGRALADLSAEDFAKQLLIATIHVIEEIGNRTAGEAALALESARGGLDRFSPIASAAYAAIGRGNPEASAVGRSTLAHLLLTLDKHEEDRPAPAGVNGMPPVRLPISWSGSARADLMTWEGEDLERFRELEALLGQGGGREAFDRREMLYRRLQLDPALSVSALVKEFDPARTIDSARAARKAAGFSTAADRTLDHLANGTALPEDLKRQLDDRARDHWVSEWALKDELRSAVDISPAELARSREAVLNDYRRRAAEKILFQRLEKGFPDTLKDKVALATLRTAVTRLMATIADRGSKAADLLAPPESLLGPKGMFGTREEVDAFRLRLRELLLPVAAQDGLERATVGEDRGRIEDEFLRNWLLGTFGAWWADRHAPSLANEAATLDTRRRAVGAAVVVGFGPNPLDALAANAAVTNMVPPDPSKSRLSDLLADCRERESTAYRAVSLEAAAPQDAVKDNQRKLYDYGEKMRALQIEIRDAKHGALLFAQKIFGIEERLRVSDRFAAEGKTDHPFFLDKTQAPKAKAVLVELRGKLASMKAKLRASEDRFIALVSGSAEEMGAAARAIESAKVSVNQDKDSADKAATNAFVACVDAHVQRKRAALTALGVDTTLSDQTTNYERHRAFAAINLLRRLRAAARRHVESGGKVDAPPVEVRTLLSADAAALNLPGIESGFARKLWAEEVNRFETFESGYKAALAPLEKYGISRTALEKSPPDIAGLTIPKDESVTEEKLRASFRAAARFREGRFVGVAYAEADWDKSPLADLAFEQARLVVMAQWADVGRPNIVALHKGQLVRRVPKRCDGGEKCVYETAATVQFQPNADRGDYNLVFTDAATEIDKGHQALAKAQKVLENHELFVDLRSSAQHWIDVFDHGTKAKGEIDKQVGDLNAAIALFERLDGVSFVHEGRETSGASLVSHFRAEREGGFRSELDETLANIENDIIWRNISGTLFVAALILTIATAGAGTPLAAGIHAALVVNALTQTQSIMNTLAYGADQKWGSKLHDKNANWSETGRSNLISTALFFLGGAGSAALTRAIGSAAEVALNARQAGVTFSEARVAVAQVRALQAQGLAAEGTEAGRVVMSVGRGASLAESVARLDGALAWYQGGVLRVLHATGPFPAMTINYGVAVGGHTVVDIGTAMWQGRKVDSNFVYRAIGKHAASEISTALFIGGGDRFLADRIGRFMTRAVGARPWLTWTTQMVGAGSVNVTISLTGKRVGDWLSDVEYARMFDKLLATPGDDPGIAARRDAELVSLIETVEKTKKLQHDAEAREWMHRLVVDIGIFGRRAANGSFRAQATLRAASAIRAGEAPDVVRQRMIKEMRPGLEERLDNPRAFLAPRDAGLPKHFHEAAGGADVIVALLEASAGAGKESGNAKKAVREEFDSLVDGLKAEGFIDVNHRELERMVRRFAADPDFARQALLVGIEPKNPSEPMRYQGSMTSFGVWVRRELRLDEAKAARTSRLAATSGNDVALKQERDAWFKLLAVDGRMANDMPSDLLVLPNRAEVRGRAIETLAIANDIDPALLKRFLDRVAPVGGPIPASATLRGFIEELHRAAPIDPITPVRWMTDRKVSLSDYTRIFGVSDAVGIVSLEMILTTERAGAKRITDEAKFRVWFEANWTRFAGRHLSVDGWMALHRSMGSP